MPRSNPATAEYIALLQAMDENRPACRDYELFTADEVDDAQLALAKRLCAECPLTAYCAAYAAASKPTVGIWAGTNYGASKRRRTRKKP